MRTKKSHPLQGLFFHTLKDGKLESQGNVVEIVEDSLLVELYSWFSGEPTCMHLVSLVESKWNDETKTGWLFYKTREEWLESAKDGYAKQFENTGERIESAEAGERHLVMPSSRSRAAADEALKKILPPTD